MKEYREFLHASDNWMKGIPAAAGLYIGNAYVYSKETIVVKEGKIKDVEEAVVAYREAIARSKKEME
jgi:PEP-utilising enzyme, N-terminal.